MRNLFKYMMIIGLLTSCSPKESLESVKNEFPNSKIYSKYNSNFIFVVIDSSSVKLVKTNGFLSNKVTDIDVLLLR